MTHPTLTAIDAAIATHGWPADTTSIYVSGPSALRDTLYCSVTPREGGVSLRANADTLVGAYDAAYRELANLKALRADREAIAEARKVLIAAGLSPELLAKG